MRLSGWAEILFTGLTLLSLRVLASQASLVLKPAIPLSETFLIRVCHDEIDIKTLNSTNLRYRSTVLGCLEMGSSTGYIKKHIMEPLLGGLILPHGPGTCAKEPLELNKGKGRKGTRQQAPVPSLQVVYPLSFVAFMALNSPRVGWLLSLVA